MANLVSVIVPIYNPGSRLVDCLDSIINQTYTNLEILLIDDGSSDGSGTICDEYAEKDKRIKVFHKPNGGVSSARNVGLKNATGDYILFVDSDDYIEQTCVSVAITYALENNAQLVSFGYTTQKDNGFEYDVTMPNFMGLADYKAFDDYVCKGYSLYVWNKLIKKDVIIKYFNEQYKLCEDMLFCSQFFGGLIKICIVKDVLYHNTGAEKLSKVYPDDYLQGLNLILTKALRNFDCSIMDIPHFCAMLYVLTMRCISKKTKEDKKLVMQKSKNFRKVLLKYAKAQTAENKRIIFFAKLGLEGIVLKISR